MSGVEARNTERREEVKEEQGRKYLLSTFNPSRLLGSETAEAERA